MDKQIIDAQLSQFQSIRDHISDFVTGYVKDNNNSAEDRISVFDKAVKLHLDFEDLELGACKICCRICPVELMSLTESFGRVCSVECQDQLDIYNS